MKDWEKPPFSLAKPWTYFFQTSRRYYTGEVLSHVLAFVRSWEKWKSVCKQLDKVGGAFYDLLIERRLVHASLTGGQQTTTASTPGETFRNVQESEFSILSLRSCSFVTYGGYLGRSTKNSHDVKPVDVCCVLFGGSEPFILRPAGDYFTLVDWAYIHGAVKGEFIDRLEAGELEERIFIIR